MSETLLVALGIAGVGALAGILGTLINTADKGGLKGFLVLVILGTVGAGGYKTYQLESFAKSETQRAEEALRVAKESGRIAGDELVKHELFRQQASSDKEKLLADRKNTVALTVAVAGELNALLEKVAELQTAAEKARKKDIAEAAETARFEAGKKLFDMAHKQNWLGTVASAKMEKTISKNDPLKEKDLKTILDKMSAALSQSPIESADTP